MSLLLLLACTLGSAPTTNAGTHGAVPKDLPVPEVGAPVAALPAIAGDRYQLGGRVVLGALAVWPVLDTRPSTAGDYLTLADGLAAGSVAVSEKDGGTVPQLLVDNKGDTPLLLAAGDVVTGGRQDRVLVADHVVPPHSSAAVDVNCVEQGRWSGGASFGYGGRAEYGLKETLQVEKDQSRTWAKVAELNDAKQKALAARGVDEDELAPSTGTYRASLEADTVKAEAAPYEALVAGALAGDKVVGVVVAFDGQVVGTELFGSPALLGRNRVAIAQGVARDAVSRGTGSGAAAPADTVAAAFLTDAVTAKPTVTAATPSGVKVETDGASTRGYDLLEADGDIVHKSSYKK